MGQEFRSGRNPRRIQRDLFAAELGRQRQCADRFPTGGSALNASHGLSDQRRLHERTAEEPAFPVGSLIIQVLDVYNYLIVYTSMRTNIVIDDKLMRDTLRATGLKTKREAVEAALRTLLRISKQGEIRRLRGKLDWQGDLDAMRTDR